MKNNRAGFPVSVFSLPSKLCQQGIHAKRMCFIQIKKSKLASIILISYSSALQSYHLMFPEIKCLFSEHIKQENHMAKNWPPHDKN